MEMNESPLACDMTAIPAESRQRHLTASQELFAQIRETHELPDGYQFQFADEPKIVNRLAEFVSLEKLCCPFLNFAIEIEAENGPVWLRLTGREGVKEFIREEVSGLTGLTGFAG